MVPPVSSADRRRLLLVASATEPFAALALVVAPVGSETPMGAQLLSFLTYVLGPTAVARDASALAAGDAPADSGRAGTVAILPVVGVWAYVLRRRPSPRWRGSTTTAPSAR